MERATGFYPVLCGFDSYQRYLAVRTCWDGYLAFNQN